MNLEKEKIKSLSKRNSMLEKFWIVPFVLGTFLGSFWYFLILSLRKLLFYIKYVWFCILHGNMPRKSLYQKKTHCWKDTVYAAGLCLPFVYEFIKLCWVVSMMVALKYWNICVVLCGVVLHWCCRNPPYCNVVRIWMLDWHSLSLCLLCSALLCFQNIWVRYFN